MECLIENSAVIVLEQIIGCLIVFQMPAGGTSVEAVHGIVAPLRDCG